MSNCKVRTVCLRAESDDLWRPILIYKKTQQLDKGSNLDYLLNSQTP